MPIKSPAPVWLGKGRKKTGARVRRLSTLKLERIHFPVNTECSLGFIWQCGLRVFAHSVVLFRRSLAIPSPSELIVKFSRRLGLSYASNFRTGVTASRTDVKEAVISDIF